MHKLFVGNLPYEVTSEELGQYFSQFGEIIEAVVITDRFNGRSKGYGFVKFTGEDAANQAIDAINGREYKNRKLVVNKATPSARDKVQQQPWGQNAF